MGVSRTSGRRVCDRRANSRWGKAFTKQPMVSPCFTRRAPRFTRGDSVALTTSRRNGSPSRLACREGDRSMLAVLLRRCRFALVAALVVTACAHGADAAAEHEAQTDMSNADQVFALAQWCDQNGLKTKALKY